MSGEYDPEMHATDLEVTQDEQAIGIHTVTALRFKMVTTMIVETVDGFQVASTYVNYDEELARFQARRKAIRALQELRIKRAGRQRMSEAAE